MIWPTRCILHRQYNCRKTDGSLQQMTYPPPLYLLDDYATVSIKEILALIVFLVIYGKEYHIKVLNGLNYFGATLWRVRVQEESAWKHDEASWSRARRALVLQDNDERQYLQHWLSDPKFDFKTIYFQDHFHPKRKHQQNSQPVMQSIQTLGYC